ncbi:MAG: ATP-grasp domain-containing protein [Candidatus Omnitrophota bacterium]
MKRDISICIVYNLKDPARQDDSQEEYDEIETIEGLKREIENNGLKVSLLEQDDHFLSKIQQNRPDLVFNIAEGKGKTRSRESQVPCMLESLGIPYFGSDPFSLGLTLDKYMTNVVLRSAGIPVPAVYMVDKHGGVDDLGNIFDEHERFIVKPRWEGSSKGIFSDSIVTGPGSLRKKTEYILSNYSQPVIIEEFIEKDEITVGVLGNAEPQVLCMMRISPLEVRQGHFVYSIENKRDWEKKIKYEPSGMIDKSIRDKIEHFASEAFRALELRDLARIDFRVDHSGIPRIIDVNPLPGLSPRYSDLMIMYRLAGGGYPDLIKKILAAFLTRCGFALPVHK